MINFNKRNVNIIAFSVSCIIYILINLVISSNKNDSKELIAENNSFTSVLIKCIEINENIQSDMKTKINNSETKTNATGDKSIKSDKEKTRYK